VHPELHKIGQGVSNSETTRISLWSGPRNVSTAILYAFSQRKDIHVFDEPLYAHYLSHSDAHQFHPASELILQTQENDGQRVVENILLGESNAPELFFKNMAHHLVHLDWSFLLRLKNILLIRDPRDMLHSYSKTIEDFKIEDTGYPQLKAICDYLKQQGVRPFVLDSKRLLLDPEKSLRDICEYSDVEFDPAMLAWPTGPKPFEGVWAPHWYHNVWRSTGFQPFQEKTEPFPEKLAPLLEICRPYYDYLTGYQQN
jgi:hypothetical protein